MNFRFVQSGRLGIALLAFGMATLSFGQSFQQYLHLRRLYHIRFGSSVVALDSLVGERTLEIAATINGDFEANGHSVLLVEDVSGESINVIANSPPSWLIGNAVKARIIVRAYRKSAHAPLEARLLGAAPESDVEDVEYQEKEQDALKAKALQAQMERAKWNHSLASRHQASRKWYLPSYQVAPYYAKYIIHQNSKLGWDQAMKIANEILGFGQMYGVDPRLVMAMVTVESNFDTHSVSRAGAMGLGQLMPTNARDLGISNPFSSSQNLYGSVKLLRENLEKYRKQTGKDFDALVLCMAAYNAGNGAVARYHGVPPYRETQAYVRRVVSLYYQFCGK